MEYKFGLPCKTLGDSFDGKAPQILPYRKQCAEKYGLVFDDFVFNHV